MLEVCDLRLLFLEILSGNVLADCIIFRVCPWNFVHLVCVQGIYKINNGGIAYTCNLLYCIEVKT